MTGASPDDEAIVRASERAVQRVMRGLHTGLTRDDLLQEGRIAAWMARRGGRVPDEPGHARRYLARRASGAMLDAVRADRRQLPHDAVEWLAEAGEQAHTPDMHAGLRLRDAIAALRRRGSWRMVECVGLLAQGHEAQEVAATLGIDPSRVSQLRKRAREIVGQW